MTLVERYPPNTPRLPLVCGSPACPCRGMRTTSTDNGSGLTMDAHPTPTGWTGELYDEDGGLVDVFRADTMDDLILAVHANYPAATFDPGV